MLRRSRAALLHVALLALLAAGCASALEKARESRAEGDERAAERLYRDAVDKGGEDADAARRELADLLCLRAKDLEDPGEAEVIFRDAAQLDPQSADAHLGVARSVLRQGRRDEALAVLDQAPDCTGCERMLGLLHAEDGELLLSKGNVDGARKAFQRAKELLPEEPAGYLGLARTFDDPGTPDALALLEEGAKHLREGSEEIERFLLVRRGIALACAKEGNDACLGRALSIDAPGAGGEPWFELQLAVAEERLAAADIDGATGRLAQLLAKYSDTMGDRLRAEYRVRLLKLYEQRAARRLRDEQAKGAEQDLVAAIALNPRDGSLALRRIIAVAGQGRLDEAVKLLNEVPESTKGRIEVLAVLLALRVEEQIEAGNYELALKLLEKAQAASPDQPEVRLALAQVLAITELEGVTDKERKRLERYGLAKYPDGLLLRYGEALSEVDWARKQVDSLGLGYAYRGPAIERRLERFTDEVRKYYPFEVGFREEGDTLLQVRSAKKTGFRLEVRGPGGLKTKVEVPQEGVVEVLVPEPGLVLLETDAWRAAIYTEPYTRLTVAL